MPKREKDRASGTGRNDRDKKSGAGAFSWGKSDGSGDNKASPMSKNDPNNAGGAFALGLEKRSRHNYISMEDLTNPLFYEGVICAFRARGGGYTTGAWVATTVSNTVSFDSDGTPLNNTSFDKDFRNASPISEGFSNIEGFMAKETIGPAMGTVIVAAESENCTTRKFIEAAIASGTHVLDVGVLTKAEIAHVVKSYNEKAWTDKSEFDKVVASAPELVMNSNPMLAAKAKGSAGVTEQKGGDTAKVGMSDAEKEAKRAADDEKIFKAAAWSASRLDKSKYIVYDDDDSLGKQAPSIDDLVYHKGDKISYPGAKFTVVGFWGKFAKGDYSTLNSWSHLERKYRSKGVQFLGVSRDRKEGDVVKFVGRLGTFMRELGERGITLGATFPLAFDPDTKVGEEFRTLSGLMSLAVGMAYVVDASGKILWREQFSRGAAPANQLEAQLDLLTSGKSVALTNGNEPDEDDEEDDDGEGTVQGISIVAAGADY